MVKTKWLRWTLDRVLGRSLGRYVSGDEEKVPQHRRLVTSTRRKRTTIDVAKDVENVDNVADEPYEEPHNIVTEDVGGDSQGFLGGSQDTSVLMSYVDHVAAKLVSHERKVEKFGRPAPKIEVIVATTGFSSLITYSLETGDKGLLFAFAERWNNKTNNFHLPIRELSITLDDVASLLHLPITSAFYTFDAINVEQFLEMSIQDAKDEIEHCRGAYVRLAWLRDSWIYEHFPKIRNIIVDEDYYERKPCVCRWKYEKTLLVTTYSKHLDKLTSDVVC
ncbi:Protein MAIN-LIKE 2 [Glycine max]|nr:Protein MAIN-LIKE 2 [Glycine max]